VKGRAGYLSGSKGEREVFSGEGFPSEGRGENGIFFREIEKDYGRARGVFRRRAFS
jgi:hypothetical protein